MEQEWDIRAQGDRLHGVLKVVATIVCVREFQDLRSERRVTYPPLLGAGTVHYVIDVGSYNNELENFSDVACLSVRP